MITSTEIGKIMPALLKAQSSIKIIKKDAENKFFKSSYATLEATIQAIQEPLNKNGIVFLQPLVSEESGTYVETTLVHESGEFITSKMRIEQSKANDPQSQGSAISYARRYSLQAILSLGTEDDDAEQAMARPAGPTYPRPQAPAYQQRPPFQPSRDGQPPLPTETRQYTKTIK